MTCEVPIAPAESISIHGASLSTKSQATSSPITYGVCELFHCCEDTHVYFREASKSMVQKQSLKWSESICFFGMASPLDPPTSCMLTVIIYAAQSEPTFAESLFHHCTCIITQQKSARYNHFAWSHLPFIVIASSTYSNSWNWTIFSMAIWTPSSPILL